MNLIYPLCFIFLLIISGCEFRQDKRNDWPVYGGDKASTHYSSLNQIDTSNVRQLQQAWIYHTGDADSLSQIEVNPIVIENVLYSVSPKLKLFALDPSTGTQKWVFDPNDPPSPSFAVNTCRGIAAYQGKNRQLKLFYTVFDHLYCIDATTGKPDSSFGSFGKVDLHDGLGRDVSSLFITSTSPGMIYKELIIVGTRVGEDATAAPGHIRAFDVHTGKMRWIFHTIPQPGESGFDSWEDREAYRYAGGANAWAGFSLDEQNGILFAPVGSASPDFYGGQRKGNNLFANCVLALDAATGKRIWHFQTIHHDVWDRDLPTSPVLVNIQVNGKSVEAVAQVTKGGFIFLLDRKTGKPVFPVEERAVPTESDLPGEELSPTQPYPTVLPTFVRQSMQQGDLNQLMSASAFDSLLLQFRGYKSGHMFHAPSRQGTVIFPGTDGGAEWGGPAFDQETGLLFVNANQVPWIMTMIDAPKLEQNAGEGSYGQAGLNLYRANCKSCHGDQLQGGENFPALINASKRYTEKQFTDLLTTGRRMMPAFPQLSEVDKEALAAFVLDLKRKLQQLYEKEQKVKPSYAQTPYIPTGYIKFVTTEGYPAVSPPWGTLTAIDLARGKIVWNDTLGDYPEFKAKGIRTGTENYGGPVVTAGGLLFIAATRDAKLRAFHKLSGKLLWEADLPAPGFATPAVYRSQGKDYVVIACGGGKLKQHSADAYVAFSLP